MIDESVLQQAVDALVATGQPERIVLFGSHARGDARADSDLDFLVVQTEVRDRAGDMVRLRRALRPLRIGADVLVVSREELQRYGREPGSIYYWALKEGRTVHG